MLSLPRDYNFEITIQGVRHLMDMNLDVNMNHELAQLAGVWRRRMNRWYGTGVGACLAEFESGTAPQKQPVNWNRVLGLGTVLMVVALGWTTVGIAVSHFLR